MEVGIKDDGMRIRVMIANSLIILGGFIRSLAIMTMKPDDLVAYSRQSYSTPSMLKMWSDEKLISSALNPMEQVLLEKLPVRKGRLLLLGVGGGREAIPLTELGFSVLGVDFVPEMIAATQRNAAERGLSIATLLQEISQLDVPPHSCDVVWLSTAMYSCIPTVRRRVDLLKKRVWNCLKPGGYVVLQFFCGKTKASRPVAGFLKKTFAVLTWGNTEYEHGDVLWEYAEFTHVFSSEDEIKSELTCTGFNLFHIHFGKDDYQGAALLQKPLHGS
jgi:cyclopropane fatty-acyl-phospholipid synthase-like methyltransferase